jgi:hypothetical protein
LTVALYKAAAISAGTLAFNVASRAAKEGLTETDFRSTCIEAFDDLGALDTLFSALQSALEDGETCLL